jgi:hypothetical protein
MADGDVTTVGWRQRTLQRSRIIDVVIIRLDAIGGVQANGGDGADA